MPKITDIRPQKRSGRVNIYVDDEFAAGLSRETCVQMGLKIGEEIDEETLRRAAAKDNARAAMDKALHLLGYRARTESEIRRALLQKGFNDDTAEATIERLHQLGYIDDAAFVAQYVDYAKTKNMSKKELAYKLRQKGVSAPAAETAMEQMAEDEQRQAAKAIAEKYYARAAGSPDQRRDKTAQTLYRKGFAWATIKTVLNEVAEHDDE